MQKQFLATITGPYRPGIINELAALTHQHQGAWLANKMASLEGRFAVIIKVELPGTNAAALQEAWSAIPHIELEVHQSPPARATATRSMELTVDARDQPGLINDITRVISAREISVDHMASHRISVAETGSTVFTAEFCLTTPVELEPETLVTELETLYPHLAAHAALVAD